LEVGGETIIATPEHPFWLQNSGWLPAGMLREGDQVQALGHETKRVTRSQLFSRHVTVYNIEVREAHTYLVSSSKVVVHNAACIPLSNVTLSDGMSMGAQEALSAAEEFLGPGAKQLDEGVFVSADGTKMFRMTADDLAKVGNHAGTPHVNFEQGYTVKKWNGGESLRAKITFMYIYPMKNSSKQNENLKNLESVKAQLFKIDQEFKDGDVSYHTLELIEAAGGSITITGNVEGLVYLAWCRGRRISKQD
jgi:hypothetical protein